MLKVQKAAIGAADELLRSSLSFLAYAFVLFAVRQYSAVAINISLDLGVFSIAF